jgi:hypothetical protein
MTISLSDPLWRLANLYSVKRAEDGKVIPFVPRAEQMQVFDMLVRQKVRRLIILKARRLGMSTGIDLLLTDQVLFNAGLQASIVDQTASDAERKLATIVKTAIEHMPPKMRSALVVEKESASQLEVSLGGDTASALFAGLRARGGTNNWLHLSEWGVIQADDPRRSEEILTGAIPSAEHGTVVVETTWKGGRGGHLWNLVCEAQETPDEAKTDKDWRLVFFPWWVDPTYTVSGDVRSIGRENARYLADIERQIGRTLTDGQKLWYDRQQRSLGMFIFREFPSVIEECFRAPVEGAIYADVLDRIRAEGAIGPRIVDESALVHTTWDLGSPANVVTWYFQLFGNEVRVIDCDTNLDKTPVQRVGHMLAKGYNFGSHYLPHDAGTTNTSGRSFVQELGEAGLKNLRVVPRTIDVWIGINRLRQILPRFTFRTPACDRGLDALMAYHHKPESSTGLAKDEPVHDWASHASDALRILAEAEMAGMIKPLHTPVAATVVTGLRDAGVTHRRTLVVRR